MLGYFGVSIVHRTLTWTTGSLTCVRDLFACVYTRGTSIDSLIRRTFAGDLVFYPHAKLGDRGGHSDLCCCVHEKRNVTSFQRQHSDAEREETPKIAIRLPLLPTSFRLGLKRILNRTGRGVLGAESTIKGR